MKKTVITGMFVLAFSQGIYAEFGANVLIGVNYKADFGVKPGAYMPIDPGAETGIADRYYADGYNRIDSSGSFGDQTSYWGYEDPSQFDAGLYTVTMNSQRLLVSQNESVHTDQNDGQPGLEFWWQGTLLSGSRKEIYQAAELRKEPEHYWYLDFRAALRWQYVGMEHKGTINSEAEIVSDVYSTRGSLPPPAPFNGTFEGPNMLLDAVPLSRTVTPGATGSMTGYYDLSANLFALDLGPSMVFDLDMGARFVLSGGASVALTLSEFEYDYGRSLNGSDTMEDVLFGGYLSIDMIFMEGASLGFATYRLQQLEHSSKGHYATLDFSDNYTFRFGLAF